MAVKRFEIAGSGLLQVPSDLERLGSSIKFHPMGAGADFLKRGVRANVSADNLKLILKWLKAAKWRSSILNKASNVRKDGQWFVNPDFEQRDGKMVTTHVFVGQPDSKGNGDVLVVTKIYKTSAKDMASNI